MTALPSAAPVELVRQEPTAHEAIAEIRAGRASPLDYVERAIARIEETDPFINAMPVRCFERARADARRIMEAVARGGEWPLLHGLPLSIKDNSDLAGVPTSGGSALTAGRTPACSDPAIALLEGNGGTALGKTNLSELGGANTVNALFGATRNPHDLALTVGGSSGGAAAGLAAGQVFFAHGNDVGGSLRTPAAFCGVAGLRPTPGMVPRKPASDPFDFIFVEGPMARTVEDLALMLDAMSGRRHDDLLSRQATGSFSDPSWTDIGELRIAVSSDLGLLPVAADVRADFELLVASLADDRALAIEAATPDFSGIDEMIPTLRALSYIGAWGGHWPDQRGAFTPEVAGDIARGAALTGPMIGAAMRQRGVYYRRMLAFFERFDLMLLPATQVRPFAIDLGWPRRIGETPARSYMDWVAITYIWSMLACPALVVPLGRAADGLPRSVQIVGPPFSEATLLAFGRRLERGSRS